MLVSGEGKTDLGDLDYSDPVGFNKGPMACLVEMIIKSCTSETVNIALIHKQVLTKQAKGQKKMKLPGKKNRKTTGYFYKNAYTLGQIALERGCDVAILFRDADGTHKY